MDGGVSSSSSPTHPPRNDKNISMQVLQGMEEKREELEEAEARLVHEQRQRERQEALAAAAASKPAAAGGKKKGKGGKGKGRQEGEAAEEEGLPPCPRPPPRADDEALQETQVGG